MSQTPRFFHYEWTQLKTLSHFWQDIVQSANSLKCEALYKIGYVLRLVFHLDDDIWLWNFDLFTDLLDEHGSCDTVGDVDTGVSLCSTFVYKAYENSHLILDYQNLYLFLPS